jgi:hypothetical protein
MSPAQRRSSAARRWLLAVVALVAVGAVAGVALSRGTSRTESASSATSAPSPSSTALPVQDPGTAATGTAPRTPTRPVATDPPTSVATDTSVRAPEGVAQVALTYAGWDAPSASVEVDAFVGDLIEDGGTCTLTLSRAGTGSRVVSGAASADATTTICAPLHVAGDQLASGTWTATVTYSSASGSGSSDPAEVTVP